MLSMVMATLVGAAVGVSSGPDLSEKAQSIDLPIDRVMVFSDRARVTRSASLGWTGAFGVRVVRAPDLPGNVMPDSLRVTATGARVLRVETRPVQRERWSIDQVDAWLQALESQGDQLSLVQGKLGSARSELDLLSGLQAAPALAEKDRVGKTLVLAPDSWRSVQDRVSQRRAAARVRESALEQELQKLSIAWQKAQREVQQRNLGGFSEARLEVLIILEGEAGKTPGTLSVEYAVPGAFWKPAYDLHFNPDIAKVELKAAGLVSQSSGEDWKNVHLSLSTAIPGLGIDLPALQTWTLGDDREYVPQPTARQAPRTARPFLAPAARPRIAELEREAERGLLQTRTRQLLALANSQKQTIDFSDISIAGELARPTGNDVKNRKKTNFDFKIEGKVNDGRYAFDDAEIAGELDAPAPMPSVVASSPSSVPGVMVKAGAFFDRLREETPTTTRGLALYRGDAWRPQMFSDPTLPAVSAGGFDYVYEAPLAVTVPSQAEQLRVPLASRSYEVTTFYEATPSLATTAYLKAAVKNGSRLPILAGPANVFVKGTFSGDVQLQTTGPGGALELPLGADEDIRLTRTVIPATTTQGFLFGSEDVTDYVVKIEVGNYKKMPITLRVVDQLPKTNAEKIKVELVSAQPKPQANADADGLLYWHVDVAAGATKTLTFSYRITRPKGWRLQ